MKNKMKVVRVPANFKNAIIFPDLHIPKQDAHAIALVKKYARENKADVIILNGDVMDSAAFGRHGHKPKDEQVGKYFDQTYELLATLRSDFPNALIYWIEGNHDLWFARYIQQNARPLQNDSYFTIQKRLKLDELSIQYLTEDTALRFADMDILHGHQFFRGRAQAVNPAMTIFNTMGRNVTISHVHRVHAFHKRLPMNEVVTSCYTTGCLSELSPDYNPLASYMTGFMHLRRGGSRAIVRNLIIEKEILF
jgi:predicted phosphodiesterase